ncbi:hypothetical protein HDU96_010950 [Phlyctochytrium bullatum]|nr:hypothetical protein HDU96_010950 [Phlyctochytrium bullatum]
MPASSMKYSIGDIPRGRIYKRCFRFRSQALGSIYRSLANPNPKLRMNFVELLEKGQLESGYFNNDFIKGSVFLEQFSMKDSGEKEAFLRTLGTTLNDFPTDYCTYKILPELINAVEFGGGSAKTLGLIVKIGERLSEDDYLNLIIPGILRLFASPDRAIRVALCDHLGSFVQYLNEKTTTEKVFPNLPDLPSPTFSNPELDMRAKQVSKNGDRFSSGNVPVKEGWDSEGWDESDSWDTPSKSNAEVKRATEAPSFAKASSGFESRVSNSDWDSWDDNNWDNKAGPSSPASPTSSLKLAASSPLAAEGIDKETARRLKKEQLALLREQKKAALAAKRVQAKT